VANARVRVITAGRPSGIAATARVTAINSESNSSEPVAINNSITIIDIIIVKIPICFAKVSNLSLNSFLHEIKI